MTWFISKNLIFAFVLLLAATNTALAASSICKETNIGIPLRDAPIPSLPKDSNEVMKALGPPFFVTYEASRNADILVYVDGYFQGSRTIKSAADPAIMEFSDSQYRACGMAVIFEFLPDATKIIYRALQPEDLMKAHASKFADTTWAK